jgi:plasmid stabilization system protein ParE
VTRLGLTPEAELDIDEAHLWYHTQARDRAAAFLAAVGRDSTLREGRGFVMRGAVGVL